MIVCQKIACVSKNSLCVKRNQRVMFLARVTHRLGSFLVFEWYRIQALCPSSVKYVSRVSGENLSEKESSLSTPILPSPSFPLNFGFTSTVVRPSVGFYRDLFARCRN
jgi:hypothetical protein